MAKPKITHNPIEAKTHWQNPNYSAIPVGLECLRQIPHREEKLTYVSFYHYNGYILKTKEVHSLYQTLDSQCFEIYFGQN